jgi:hypothetical protein
MTLLTGCQIKYAENIECRKLVDEQFPAVIEKRNIKSETVCNSRGAIVELTKGASMNCTIEPVFEDVVINQVQRDNAFAACNMKQKK